ncbi:MAG: phosphonate ABC transporter, permease protein PhnE [Anaerolineales bacterium]|nr:phosphonate ABC transporter, permease protein PhnE [Anaerolineales bacterium]
MSIRHDPQAEANRMPSLVPPVIAAVASAIIPGFGQVLGRAYRRGFLILFSLATILGLTVWRFRRAAPRDEGFVDIFNKALHLDKFLWLVLILIGILYIWIIVDAYLLAKRSGTGTSMGAGLLFINLIVFFALGWQIGQINLTAIATGMDEGIGPLQRLAWPWERAVDYEEVVLFPTADIQVPCHEDFAPPEPSTPTNEAYIVADPTCGTLSEQGGESGTILHLEGFNYTPGIETQIKWKDPLRNEFRQRQEGEYVIVVPDENGHFEVDIIMPYRLLPPSATDPTYIWEVGGEQIAAVGDAFVSDALKLTIEKMIETIFIGMMATFFGIILALPVSFLAARNLMSASPVTLAIYYLVRTILNIIRSIEPLIWAIVFVIVVGLGPFAGILALTLHSIAALGKLYSEAIESIDPGPIEAIQATGATWLQTVMFAVVPQIVPPFVSFTIYRWDINIRMSTIIGMVGGGGIGFLLVQYIRLLQYDYAGLCVWFIAVTVAILDYVSAEIRARFV